MTSNFPSTVSDTAVKDTAVTSASMTSASMHEVAEREASMTSASMASASAGDGSWVKGEGARWGAPLRRLGWGGSLVAFLLGVGGLLAMGSAEGESLPVVSASSAGRELPSPPRLYQVLYDAPTDSRTGELGQKLRIALWIKYMALSTSQQELLLTLAQRFKSREKVWLEEQAQELARYEAALDPLYQEAFAQVASGTATEATLEVLAQQLEGVHITLRQEEKLQTARVKAVRAVLSDAREFLNSLDPVQEEKLVSSLFFLRREVDPFATPGTYRELVGPTWNAGDFSALLSQKNRTDSHLNIGGLWDIDTETSERFNYVNIQRPMLMFYVLKEPTLMPTLEALLGVTPSRVP